MELAINAKGISLRNNPNSVRELQNIIAKYYITIRKKGAFSGEDVKIQVITENIQNNFSDLTIQDIEKAYSLALAEKLPNFKLKDAIEDAPKMLNAFRVWRAAQLAYQTVKEETTPQNEIDQRNLENAQTYLKEYKQLKRRIRRNLFHREGIYLLHFGNIGHNLVKMKLSDMYENLTTYKLIKPVKKEELAKITDYCHDITYNKLLSPLNKELTNQAKAGIKLAKEEGNTHLIVQKEAKSLIHYYCLRALIENSLDSIGIR